MAKSGDNPPAIHSIRLRGPAWLIGSDADQKECSRSRIKTPCDIEIADRDDELRYSVQRSFGSPTGLEEQQKVEMHFSEFKNAVTILINGAAVSGKEVAIEKSFRIDVTEILKERNTLAVVFEMPGRFGEVELQIPN